MTMYGRNDTTPLAALSAEEQRRRAAEDASSGERRAARELERETSRGLLGVGLARLVGVGDRIGLVVGPVLLIGLVANVARPSTFSVGGPPDLLRIASVALLVPGLVVWLWSAALILLRVPRDELITSGPFRIVRHPLYTGVALLVLPWAGFLLNSWLGLLVGLVLYGASRWFSPREEAELAARFGPAWERYATSVLLPWL